MKRLHKRLANIATVISSLLSLSPSMHLNLYAMEAKEKGELKIEEGKDEKKPEEQLAGLDKKATEAEKNGDFGKTPPALWDANLCKLYLYNTLKKEMECTKQKITIEKLNNLAKAGKGDVENYLKTKDLIAFRLPNGIVMYLDPAAKPCTLKVMKVGDLLNENDPNEIKERIMII